MKHLALCCATLLAPVLLLSGCTDKGNVSDAPNGIIESSTLSTTQSTTAARDEAGLPNESSAATTAPQDSTAPDTPARSRTRKILR